ncbi:MAG: hypothetical protein ACD_4C00313G0004 [uncultured bacterium (gcode 4)]|uniref:Copper-sensing transcriptional repressor CsoR n=1 Tax=uncultured bacterium (gcode 4) TaxID=1234023 RepID=K2FWU9_9BACT|nr:MAG: hypothetical protein ACD_4C00313G0004 [uncultured bacterium (gcode 4)]
MVEPYKSKLLTNIKKTKWLLETITKMIENERYCMDIAQQINAAEWFLKSSSNLILKSHLNSCAAHKLTSDNNKEKEEFIEELVKVFHISK